MPMSRDVTRIRSFDRCIITGLLRYVVHVECTAGVNIHVHTLYVREGDHSFIIGPFHTDLYIGWFPVVCVFMFMYVLVGQ